MDDLFAKDEREINGLLSTVQIFSNDIQMEFRIKVWNPGYERRKDNIN